MTRQKNEHALMDLISYQIRAVQSGHWLEALVLTHMFVETQLRLILSGLPGPTGKPITQNKIDKQRSVIELARLAKDNGLVTLDTWEMIREFNTARNNAVHNLGRGNISYNELRPAALKASEVVSDLQRYYVTVTIGPELRADE